MVDSHVMPSLNDSFVARTSASSRLDTLNSSPDVIVSEVAEFEIAV
jgi:hypothetical protein